MKDCDTEAIQILQKSLDTNVLSYDDQSMLCYYLALLYTKQKNYHSAIFYCQNVLNHPGTLFFYCQTFALLSEIYETIGDYKKSNDFCTQFLDIWKYADKDLPLLTTIKERQNRTRENE